jgi:hypothetical protein
MTIGIYKLSFLNTDKVYIGQAVDIEARFTRHIRYMRQGISSIKLNEAYKLYGNPTCIILIECSQIELDSYEKEAIDIYNAVDYGFNSYSEAGGKSSSCGTNHYNSKYTKAQLLDTFFLLLDPRNLPIDISKLTDIPVGSINSMARGASHTWISSEYPEEYSKLMSLVGRRTTYVNTSERKGKTYPTIVSPEGIEYSGITNMTAFAKEHNLDYTGLSAVLRRAKNRVSVGGWKLK